MRCWQSPVGKAQISLFPALFSDPPGEEGDGRGQWIEKRAVSGAPRMLFLFYPIPGDNLSNILAIFSGFNSIDLRNRFCHPVAIKGAFRDVQYRSVWAGQQYSEVVVQEFKEMTSKISRLMKSLKKHEDGATAIEYGLIAGLVAIVIITGLTLLGSDLSNMFNQVSNTL